MGNRYQDTAQKIVMDFKGSLDGDLRRQISDAQYNMLEAMIREGMGKELSAATELVEELARKLRVLTDKPELGL